MLESVSSRTFCPALGVCQPFLPRSLPLQQHSIMGQPYIELRHRAPEHRLRLPFPASAELQARPVQGPPLGQQMLMQQQHVVSSAPLSQNSESALPGAEGIEEHLEGEDSAVKDLEDVEVKDLVDLNLNLDPEDGTKTMIQHHVCEHFSFMSGTVCISGSFSSWLDLFYIFLSQLV